MKRWYAILSLIFALTAASSSPAKLAGLLQGVVASRYIPSACTASGYNNPCENAYDGDTTTIWYVNNFGGWIELDLGSVQSISKIELVANQNPSGVTNHSIYYGAATNPGTLLANFNQSTATNDVLTWTGAAVQARYIRVSTSSTPSWLAWSEIRIFP